MSQGKTDWGFWSFMGFIVWSSGLSERQTLQENLIPTTKLIMHDVSNAQILSISKVLMMHCLIRLNGNLLGIVILKSMLSDHERLY